MATVINRLGALAGDLLKVILPIVLGSLIFAGILAQYNNQMRLNETILESYYQPMKEQSRKCFRLHAELQRKLAEYRGLIDEIRSLVAHGTKPPPELLKQPGDPTFPGPSRIVAIQQALSDLQDCDHLFTGYLHDLSIMLGVDAAGLDPLIDRRNRRLDQMPARNDPVFRRLHELDLGQLVVEMAQASPSQIIAMKPNWSPRLKTASDSLGELIDMFNQSISAEIHDVDEGTRIAATVLRRRFHAGPLNFIWDTRP